jgi:hypothetical protein
VSSEPLGLVRYDAMRLAIAEAYAIDEVKDIRDRVIALETYARQAQNDEDERRCREIRMRAERRVGQLLKETDRATGGGDQRSEHPSGRTTPDQPKLAEYGLTRDQSSKWQYVASLPDNEFESALNDGASTSDMVEMAKIKERGGPVEAPSTPVSTKALRLWGELGP